jgi:type II secretion system protein H
MSATTKRQREPRGGFTLTELLIVLVIAAVILAIAMPRFTGFVRELSGRSATSRVVTDLALARTQAVREGRTVSLRVTGASTYQITLDNGAAIVRTIKTVDVKGGQRNVTISPATARMIFDSRGMLVTGSSPRLLVTRTGKTDTVSVSAVGRVYRGGN